MALTPEGTPYVESTDLVANYPAASLSLANRVDLVGVLPFATSAARATAIPSPTDGQYSYLQNTNATEFWNGSAWVAAGGKILQVVSTTKTDTFSSTAASPTAITGLSATITPSLASSKVYVIFSIGRVDANTATGVAFLLKRGSTVVGGGTAVGSRLSSIISIGISGANNGVPAAANYLDSPATTSATTYSVEAWNDTSARTFFINRGNNDADNGEGSNSRSSSTITLFEVSA